MDVISSATTKPARHDGELHLQLQLQQQELQQGLDQKRMEAVLKTKDKLLGAVRIEIYQILEQHENIESVNAWYFLLRLEKKLLDLLFANKSVLRINEDFGLNSDRDTKDELETTIRLFPNVLSKHHKRNRRFDSNIAIAAQTESCYRKSNPKAAYFVPLLAKLGVELGHFEPEERGGLICYGHNVLQELARSSNYKRDPRFADSVFLSVLKELRALGFFFKEDIRAMGLAQAMLYSAKPIFPEQRLLYLAEWDSSLLMKPSTRHGFLPIHFSEAMDISTFEALLDLGLRHYPTELGGLFHKRNDILNKIVWGSDRDTPFIRACDNYGKEAVEKVVDRCFIKHKMTVGQTASSLVFAATKEIVDLDAVYYLLRRDMSTLAGALSAR